MPETVTVGGKSKAELRELLRSACVELNAYAERIFESGLFTVSDTPRQVRIAEVSVEGLGFPGGAVMPDILAGARELGLGPCPAELGPYLRLAYAEQPGVEGSLSGGGKAPEGALTVVSEPLSADDDFPKGFYLRKVNGVLWLRGYRSDAQHVLPPGDRLVFARLCYNKSVDGNISKEK